MGGDPKKINPWYRVIWSSTTPCRSMPSNVLALEQNLEIEFERNRERYQFPRWGQQASDNFRVVPPATGIVHQVNLEYLEKGF
ncbi:MAG: aconitase family protein [Planctomycetaceae bacterium]